ncbi:MAG TPA: nickel pincer cofactor biosynthesis protein LarB [Gemmatimonadaceae bacterium]|nr:nickel pincer cofactor biosynthesis protein LarB [Gemmatimonadaceae bacterium]
MTRERVRDLLGKVADGSVSPEHALDDLDKAPFESLDFATIDHHRAQRQGFPEVIYGEGKTVSQIVAIAERIAERHGAFLATRLSDDARAALAGHFHDIEINELGRTAHLPGTEKPPAGRGEVLIVTAGTSDIPVAEEAAVTSSALGNRTAQLTDVGVAGIHRLLAKKDDLFRAAVIIVIAGMDGALASVVGGLVRIPVIAVPTSVGYGAAFGGIAPLLTMLNSCAAGVTVVNIDNGFGAAVAASRINHA